MSAVTNIIGCVVLTLLAARSFGADAEPQKEELRTAAGVAVKYYLSLPRGWKSDTASPILVSIEGAGHGFAWNFHEFVKARGDRPFIIVTPFVSSNGNDPADIQAVLTIVREVQQEFKAQPKFFITGFSSGGHLTWQCVFMHPELLQGAALAAGNFRFRGIGEISKSPEVAKLAIRGFQGDKDGGVVAFTQQWNDAVDLARKNGYSEPTRTVIPGAEHQPFAAEVVAYFSTLLPK